MPSEESLKAYLLRNRVADHLEKFVASLAAERPDDVLSHLEKWARTERGGNNAEEATAAAVPAEAVAADAAGSKSAEVASAAAATATDAVEHATAAEETAPAAADAADVPAAEAAENVDADEEAEAAETRPPREVVTATWADATAAASTSTMSLEHQAAAKFFELLFLQHKILKRTIFDGVDTVALTARLATELLPRVLQPSAADGGAGELTDDELVALAAEAVAGGRDVQTKHVSAMLSALIAAVATVVGGERWSGAVPLAFNSVLGGLAARVEEAVAKAKGGANAASATPAATSPTTAGAPDAAAEGNGDAGAAAAADGGAAEAAAPPSDDEDDAAAAAGVDESLAPAERVADSWAKLPLAAQEAVVRAVFDTMIKQHTILGRTLFADVDFAAIVPPLVPLAEKLSRGALTDADIDVTGVVEAARARGAQAYHLQYAITATLTALHQAFGTRWVGPLSEPWRVAVAGLAERLEAKIFVSAPAAAEATVTAEAEAPAAA